MAADDDRLLDDYLNDDTELSRRYRLAAGYEQPPQSIDARIKAEARRVVGAGPSRARAWRAAWTAPLAAAAVLVLAVGITLQISREQDSMKTDAPPDTRVLAKRDLAKKTVPRDKAETEEPQTFSYTLPKAEPALDAERESATRAEPLEQAETGSSGASIEPLANLGRVLQSIAPGRTTARELAALPGWEPAHAESRIESGSYEKREHIDIAGLEVPGVVVSLQNGVVQAVDVNLPPGTTLQRLESALGLTGGRRTSVSSLPPAALAGFDPAGFSRAVFYENAPRYDLGPAVAFLKTVDESSQVGLIRFYSR